MRRINKNYIKKFNYFEIETKLNDNLLSARNFRVLHITNCDNSHSAIQLMKAGKFIELMQKSSHCFFLAFEIKEFYEKSIEELKKIISEILANSQKYFLLEFYQNSKSVAQFIYYKKICSHYDYQISEKIDEDDTDDEDASETQENDIHYQFHLLHKKYFKNNATIDITLSFNDCSSFFKDVIETDDPIHMRYLKLFDWKWIDEIPRLNNLVSKSKTKSFGAFLDLPIVDEKNSFPPTSLTERSIDYKFENGQKLLSIAAEKSGLDMVDLLLRLGSDVDSEDSEKNKASDYALRGKRYENLELLLENDSKFPNQFRNHFEEFKNSKYIVLRNIVEMCEARAEFHKSLPKT